MNAFESGILWRDSAPVIPNNRKVAESHLRALEKRLGQEPALKSAYDASIVSYVTNGYIRKMSKEEVASVEHGYTKMCPTIFIMTSHSLRFLVVVLKIAPSVARSRGSVKNEQKRHVGQ